MNVLYTIVHLFLGCVTDVNYTVTIKKNVFPGCEQLLQVVYYFAINVCRNVHRYRDQGNI